MARMKGFSEWRIVIRHAARNALLPVVTAFALGVGLSMGGNVVVETVFSWPGIGRLLVQAVSVQRLSAGAGRLPDDRAGAGADELRRRPALHGPRPAGDAMAERAEPVPRARRAGALRRCCAHGGDAAAAIPSPSPACSSTCCSRWSRCSPTSWRPSIRWRSCSPRPASSRANVRARRRAFRSARPISAATSTAQLVHRHARALAVGLSAAVIVATGRHHRRPGGRLLRRHDRRGADAHRRHGAQPAVPALRHRADGLPGRQHLATSCSPSRCCCGPTPRA